VQRLALGGHLRRLRKYSDILPRWVEPYFGRKAAASFIREFELQCVPGLLQIEDYAREVIRLGNLPSEDEVVRHAKARISRQEILLKDDPPKIWAVLDEGALRCLRRPGAARCARFSPRPGMRRARGRRARARFRFL
jgi:hypothetical protein